jgi:succinate dehydrogenase / fumarate reductase cytochrome b subunit
MDKSQRPLSPHLQIYRPQLTSVLSITHRGTGIALLVGTLVLVYWLLAAASGAEAYAAAQQLLASWFGRIVMTVLAWSLAYALRGGA